MVAIDIERRRPESNLDAGVTGLELSWWGHERNIRAKKDREDFHILDKHQMMLRWGKARQEAQLDYTYLLLFPLPQILFPAICQAVPILPSEPSSMPSSEKQPWPLILLVLEPPLPEHSGTIFFRVPWHVCILLCPTKKKKKETSLLYFQLEYIWHTIQRFTAWANRVKIMIQHGELLTVSQLHSPNVRNKKSPLNMEGNTFKAGSEVHALYSRREPWQNEEQFTILKK